MTYVDGVFEIEPTALLGGKTALPAVCSNPTCRRTPSKWEVVLVQGKLLWRFCDPDCLAALLRLCRVAPVHDDDYLDYLQQQGLLDDA